MWSCLAGPGWLDRLLTDGLTSDLLACLLTHLLIHSLTHSPTYSLTHLWQDRDGNGSIDFSEFASIIDRVKTQRMGATQVLSEVVKEDTQRTLTLTLTLTLALNPNPGPGAL